MQYIIQRDRSEQIVLKLEEDKVKIFQRIGNFLRPNAVFLTEDEAITLSKIILKECSYELESQTKTNTGNPRPGPQGQLCGSTAAKRGGK